jgi:lipid-binding SYLF domain-containing protein
MQRFQSDPDMGALIELMQDAEGVLIVPAMYKAGFLIGGSGGKGVLLVRDEKTGKWDGPAFYNMGAASGGLQAGVSKAEVIILAMTREAVDDLYGAAVKLGVDASIAMGPIGAGAETSAGPIPTAAYISFARAKGAYAGLTLEGTVVKTDDEMNSAYYGTKTRPVDVFVSKRAKKREALGLIDAVTQAEDAGKD